MHPPDLPSQEQPPSAAQSQQRSPAKLPGHCQRTGDWERPFIMSWSNDGFVQQSKKARKLRSMTTVPLGQVWPGLAHSLPCQTALCWSGLERRAGKRLHRKPRYISDLYYQRNLAKWWVWPTNKRKVTSGHLQQQRGETPSHTHLWPALSKSAYSFHTQPEEISPLSYAHARAHTHQHTFSSKILEHVICVLINELMTPTNYQSDSFTFDSERLAAF